jgi:hypothetical protein
MPDSESSFDAGQRHDANWLIDNGLAMRVGLIAARTCPLLATTARFSEDTRVARAFAFPFLASYAGRAASTSSGTSPTIAAEWSIHGHPVTDWRSAPLC